MVPLTSLSSDFGYQALLLRTRLELENGETGYEAVYVIVRGRSHVLAIIVQRMIDCITPGAYMHARGDARGVIMYAIAIIRMR